MQATSRILAVAGDPVAHSLSPAMHNAAIAALGLDAVYVAARTTPKAFPGLVHAMLEAGGALNVTIPFKQQAAGLVDHPTALVTRTGACNTIWGRTDEIHGDNTDVAGVRAAARALLGDSPVRSVCIVGTGGSARAAAVAVIDEWPKAGVFVHSRTADRAREFDGWMTSAGLTPGRKGPADLVINATPLGLAPDDPLPMEDGDILGPRTAVLDLVYCKGMTLFVRQAQAAGRQAADGRGVLVGQGSAAFERFFGVPAPLDVMRKAVEDALAT